jgi:hypothetical protein
MIRQYDMRFSGMVGSVIAALVLGIAIGWFGILGAVGALILGLAAYGVSHPRVLVYVLIGLVFFGQAGRIPPGSTGSAALLMDLVAMALCFLWFIWRTSQGPLRLSSNRSGIAWAGFLTLAFVMLVGTPLLISTKDIATNGFYFVRLLSYSSLAWIIPELIRTRERAVHLLHWIGWVTGGILALGFIQLYIFPDIGPLVKYGWDPHVGRLVSTFLDPNFLGGFFALSLAVWGALFLHKQLKPLPFWAGSALLLIAGVLTYSRSGYLALGIVVLTLGVRYSWKLLVLALCCALPLAMLIPRVRERVSGGFNIDATSVDRIQSWQSALRISDHFPVLGVGYNNYHNAQEAVGTLEYGTNGRSNAGSDSSLLTLLSTTGIVGIFLFFLTICFISGDAKRTARGQSVAGVAGLALLVAAPALFVHSWFVNSLLYPFILVGIATLVGLSYVRTRDEKA